MSKVSKIPLEIIKANQFNTRIAFNVFIKKNKLVFERNETVEQFINKVNKSRIFKKKLNVKKEKIIKRVEQPEMKKEIKRTDAELFFRQAQTKYLEDLKRRLENLENETNEEVFIKVKENDKVGTINDIPFYDLQIEADTIIDLILRTRYGKNTIISIDGKYYLTLTERNRETIKNLFNNEVEYLEEDSFRSFLTVYNKEPTFLIVKRPNKKLNIEAIDFLTDEDEPETKTYKKKEGAFFKYLNMTDINLEKYGIFKNFNSGQYDATDRFFNQYNNYYNCDYRDNCLFNALKYGGMEEYKLNNIKLYFKNRHISVDNLKLLCKTEEINIEIKFIKIHNGERKGDTSKIEYGKEFKERYEIGLLENHYFINDTTDYTKYAVENYFNIKDKDNFNYMYNGRGDKDKKRVISSFELVRILLENKETHLKPLTIDEDILFSNYYDKFIEDDIKNLNYNEKAIRENNEIIPREKREEGEEYDIVFFDCETDPNELHKVYLICSVNNKGEKKSFSGHNLVYNFLCSLEKNTLLIAHNAGYDFRFIYNNLRIEKFVSKGKKLMFVNAVFYNKYKKMNVDIKIRDSLNMINMPLRKFNESFDADYKTNILKPDYMIKEIMPYKFYTQENINKKYCKIVDAYDFIKENEREQFINNIKKWNCVRNEDEFDIIEYSKQYCLIDCIILKNGYMKFREMMLEITKLDINDFVSLPSIAQEYLINRGCYDNVYYLQGIPQLFISRCVVGGRTMMRDNEKQHPKNKIINDFDGVSLYPSSMNVMKGFLKGVPKVIDNIDLNIEYDDIPNFLRTVDGYFIKVKILSVGIKRHMPLGSIIKKDGTRCFTNDLVNEIQYLDNYMLEDLINFQKITYKIEQGYYFNEGLNNKINTVIEELFNERVKQKKLKNPSQLVLKELMNSSYGKTILKPIEYETKIFNNTKTYNAFINRNYEFVSEITILAGDEDDEYCKRLVKVIKNIMVHKNIPQVGVQVLSRSKRIMNEVICLAEDNNLEIYYQDTDSIHIQDKDIIILKEKYLEKYGRELEGKNLGQFHSDFDMDIKNEYGNVIEEFENVVAVDSLFCAKKMYIDKLRGINTKTGEIKYSYHRRMKGVSDAGIDYAVKEEKLNDCWELYEKLYNGESINIDLGAGGQKAVFRLNKDFSIDTLVDFKRLIKC